MPSAAEGIVGLLKEAGVDCVFGIPSIHNIPLYEALRKDQTIRHILCRQETTACHMADGYARAGGRLGVVIASTGPGTGYLVPAVQEAFGSHSPLLCITTNIPSPKIGKAVGALHELENQSDLFANITKARFCARPGDDILAMTREAVATVVSGRPGPVYLEVPTDLLGITMRKDMVHPLPDRASASPIFTDLTKTLDILREARQPLLVSGQGAIRAGLGPLITSLAEALAAPVVTTAQGKGIVPEDHAFVFGNVARKGMVREMIRACDVALAIGTSLRHTDARRRGQELPRLIHVDWDETWVGRNFDTEISLVGDITAITREILERLGPQPHQAERRHRVLEMRERLNEELRSVREGREELSYIQIIRKALPRDGMLVVDNTQLGYWSEYFYPSLSPNGFITPKGSFIIGFGFPACAGVKMAFPEKKVIALMGDGGFLYCSQELATCVRHGLGFPVIVVNDGAFSIIGHLQRTSYQKTFEHRLVNPDFVALARAYGVQAVRVDSPAAFEEALNHALDSEEMWLIELMASFPEPPYGAY